jgi:NMD protein affecting ribosome stability and mRNA decay
MINPACAQRGNEYESLFCSGCLTWKPLRAIMSEVGVYRCQSCGLYQRLLPFYSSREPFPADKGGDADDGS